MAYKEHEIFGHHYEQKLEIKRNVVHNYGSDTFQSFKCTDEDFSVLHRCNP